MSSRSPFLPLTPPAIPYPLPGQDIVTGSLLDLQSILEYAADPKLEADDTGSNDASPVDTVVCASHGAADSSFPSVRYTASRPLGFRGVSV